MERVVKEGPTRRSLWIRLRSREGGTEMLYYLLFAEIFRPLNVFRYITVRTVYASLTAIFSCAGVRTMADSQAVSQIGQYIREEGATRAQEKSGTPTMGGVLVDPFRRRSGGYVGGPVESVCDAGAVCPAGVSGDKNNYKSSKAAKFGIVGEKQDFVTVDCGEFVCWLCAAGARIA